MKANGINPNGGPASPDDVENTPDGTPNATPKKNGGNSKKTPRKAKAGDATTPTTGSAKKRKATNADAEANATTPTKAAKIKTEMDNDSLANLRIKAENAEEQSGTSVHTGVGMGAGAGISTCTNAGQLGLVARPMTGNNDPFMPISDDDVNPEDARLFYEFCNAGAAAGRRTGDIA